MRIPMNSGAFRSDFGRQDPVFRKREVLCGARDMGQLAWLIRQKRES
jgi:hypothetical protein